MAVQFKTYSTLFRSKVSKSDFYSGTTICATQNHSRYLIIASSNSPKEQGEHGNTPPTYLCIHNEILFCNSFGLAKGIFFYLCTCKYLIGLPFWFYFFYLTLMSRSFSTKPFKHLYHVTFVS